MGIIEQTIEQHRDVANFARQEIEKIAPDGNYYITRINAHTTIDCKDNR